ncbi:hypothetical protein EON80_11285 [bacterium]|nr:MAG: hypothetical protein EON80_11285 [bacterium]
MRFQKELGVSLACTLFISGFIAAVLFPVFNRARGTQCGPMCSSKLKMIGIGLIQYTQDYDEKYPLVPARNGGWVEAVYPYVKNAGVFQCPIEVNREESQEVSNAASFYPKTSGVTDYYFNSQLRGRMSSSIGDRARIIILGEGNDGQDVTDSSYSKSEIPISWRTDASSPAFRHLGGAFYGFADGHAKFMKVSEVSTNWKKGGYYFQPAKP